jgi:HSP20 family molecular chaperone IbpA
MDSKRLFLEAFKPGKRFRRVVELPTDVEANSINVSYRNGVLEIVARKK